METPHSLLTQDTVSLGMGGQWDLLSDVRVPCSTLSPQLLDVWSQDN